MIQYNRSLIMAFAHLWKKAHNISLSEALQISWASAKCLKLQELMENYVVTFEYTKKSDGSKRLATGTRSKEIVSYEKLTERKANDEVFVYFDLEANGLRSFVRRNIGKIKSFKPIEKLIRA